MNTIFKYDLRKPVKVPEQYKVLTANLHGDHKCVWIQHDSEREEMFELTFMVYGTGWSIPENPGIYVNTYFDDQFVWHVYYVVRQLEKY